MIFGAKVHDLKGSQRALLLKAWSDLQGPNDEHNDFHTR